MNEKITVIMAVYKEPEEQIRASIESILNQTYSNIEFIIILDNPDEKWRKDLIESYHDNRMKLFINRTNIGLTKSLNLGLAHATGGYIARMDADDISAPERFEKQLKFLRETEYDLCGTFLEFFNDEGTTEKVKLPYNFNIIKKNMRYYNCVFHPTWLAKKIVFEKNGGYVDISTCEDYDFLVRAVLNGFKIGNVPEFLFKYRLSLEGISRKNALKQKVISEFIQKKYRSGMSVSLVEFQKYYESKKYKKKLSCYSKFHMYNVRRTESKTLLGKIYYSFLMFLRFDVWPARIIEKLYRKRV